MRRTTPIALFLTAALTQGCTSCDQVPDSAVTDCSLSEVVPGAVKTDILFVIDDSGSMGLEQDNLSTSLQAFIDALALSPVRNDFQIGVTTTSVEFFDGTDTYSGGPNSGAQYPKGRLVSGDGTGAIFYGQATRILSSAAPPTPGDPASLVAAFMDNVIVGISGSGKEQHLWAARLALEGPNVASGGPNDGFLRSGARLAIVFITDEDDCSDSGATHVIPGLTNATGNPQCHDRINFKPYLDSLADFVTFLEAPIAGEDRRPIVALIGPLSQATLEPACGDTNNPNCAGTSGCSTGYDTADRLVSLVNTYGSLSTRRDSVCQTDFSATLEDLAGLLVSQEVPLERPPPDWRMLVVGVRRPDGTRVNCTTALAGTPEALGANAVYVPAAGDAPATLVFDGECALGQGYELEIDVICAG